MIAASLRKELTVLLASPLPWVGGALLHLLLGALYVSELEARGQALFQPAVPLAAFLLLVLVPVLTVRTVAEEVRAGTLDVLLTTPAGVGRLLVGKWAAAWVTALGVLAPAAAALVAIERWGDLDPGGVMAACLGLAAFAAACTAVGVAASALTTSQPLAAAGSFLVLLALWFASSAPGTTGAASVATRVSLSERLATFAAGGVDTGDLAYFLGVTVAGVAVAAAAAGRRRAAPRGGPGRSARLAAAIGIVTLVVVSGVGVAIADANRRLFDWTTGDALTLSSTTRAVVSTIADEVDITAYLARQDPGRVALSSLLTRYRRLNGRISFRVADPSAVSGEVRSLGIDPVFGGIVVRRGDRAEVARTPTEQDVTAALARALRDRVPLVCASEGHGEADLAETGDGGLSQLRGALEGAGNEVEAVRLLGATAVPEQCDSLLIAGPTAPLSTDVLGAVAAWVAEGGRVMLLADPITDVDWAALLKPFGIRVDRGIVFELDPAHTFPDDPTRPIVIDHRTAHPIGVRLPPTFYPGAQGLVLDPPAGQGVTVEAIARTTERSYLETAPLEPAFDSTVDRRGPITLVAAGDRSRRDGGEVVRGRVVVIADVDVATNAFVGEAGNTLLLLRSIEWLHEDADIVSVTANLAPLRPLALTEARLRYLRILSMGVVPGLLLAVGALARLLRRAR